jgi:collagenase-like PrtC family protease
MLGLRPLSLFTLSSILLVATAQSLSALQQNLTATGVAAVYPGQQNYSAATKACACDA